MELRTSIQNNLKQGKKNHLSNIQEPHRLYLKTNERQHCKNSRERRTELLIQRSTLIYDNEVQLSLRNSFLNTRNCAIHNSKIS